MFASILAAALRNLARNRLYAAISIASLAIGLAAAILTALFICSELSFDRFVPGARQVYVLTSTVRPSAQPEARLDYAPEESSGWLKPVLADADIARLAYDRVAVRRGDVEANEDIAWVDAAFFKVLPLPVAAGDARSALAQPDAVVITQAIARKYFGRPDAVGQVLQLIGHPMRVTAVIRDLPGDTHLTQQIFASGAAPFALLRRLETNTHQSQQFDNVVYNKLPGGGPVQFQPVRVRVYVRLAGQGATARLRQALARVSAEHVKSLAVFPGVAATLSAIPLGALHIYPFTGSTQGGGEAHGSVITLYAMGAIAGLILVIAGVNFVNLMTARAARRAVEVGVRKAAGARRRDLVTQFIGESVLHAVIAALFAVALTELLLPSVDAVLMHGVDFAYWRSPAAIAGLVLATLVLGVLAGAYPALVLSAFQPAAVLKGAVARVQGSGLVRQGLVVLQFAVLISLILATLVIWRQTRFAMGQGLRFDSDQMLVIEATPCRGAFLDQARKLPGVRGAACSSTQPIGLPGQGFQMNGFEGIGNRPGGPPVTYGLSLTDYGFFELYGIRPLAGRTFSRAHPADELPTMKRGVTRGGAMMLNAVAARRLGFTSPASAVGQEVELGTDRMQVIGVVPDFGIDSLHGPVAPMAYLVDFGSYPLGQVMNVKLDGRDLTETLPAIDRLWRASGNAGPIRRRFLNDYVQQAYAGTVRQGMLVSGLAAVALVIACLGLFALAAFAAEQRTQEIGVRKAMGASSRDVVGLLLMSFAKPVLWANLIAWPLGWWAMDCWLHGFAVRIDLEPWMFALAGGTALAIAAATVSTHALRVARARPTTALRHE